MTEAKAEKLGWLARTFPGMAYRHEVKVQALRDLRQMGVDRRTGPRLDGRGPVERNRQLRGPTLQAARRLVRRDDTANGFLLQQQDKIIGCGFTVSNEGDEAATKEFRRWVKSQDLWTKMRLAESEDFTAGEAIYVRSIVKEQLKIELIASERISDKEFTPKDGGNAIVQGVEFDAVTGDRVAYWIHKHHPGDAVTGIDKLKGALEPERVPADRVYHFFAPQEPGQIRGISRFATCANSFHALSDLMNSRVTQGRLAAHQAIMIKRANRHFPKTGLKSNDKDLSRTHDDLGNPLAQSAMAMVFHGGRDDSIEVTPTGTPADGIEPVFKIAYRKIATALRTAYARLTGDTTGQNYNVIRAAAIDEQKSISCRQFRHLEAFRHILGWWLIWKNPAISPEQLELELESWEIHPEGQDWVDPSKEMDSDVKGIRVGLKSALREARKRGVDIKANIRELAELKKDFEEAGLEPPVELFAMAAPLPENEPDKKGDDPKPPKGAKPKDDDEEDDDEKGARESDRAAVPRGNNAIAA